ncbi:monocarboxylate transporter 12-like [Glandiceps talaboti]
MESNPGKRYGKGFQSDDQIDRMSSDGQDGGIYGGVVIVACHVCSMFVFGGFQAIGPIFVAMQTAFGSGSARTSWIISVTGSVEMAFGCGHGLILNPHLGIVSLYIKKRYVMANALVVSGSGIGIFIFTPLWQLLIETYGWRGAFIIFAAINANLCVCGTLLKLPKMTKINFEMTGTQHFDDASIDKTDNEINTKAKPTAIRQIREICDCGLYMKYPIFDIITFALLLGIGVGFYGVPAHMVARAASMRLSSERNIALIMSIFGVAGILGRLAPTVLLLILKPLNITSTSLFGIALVLAGITNLLSSLADSYLTYCVYTAFLGLFCGLFFTLFSQAIKDVVGPSNLTAALCVSSPWGSIGGFMGPPVAGWIYDTTKDYNNSFYFYGSCMVFTGLTVVLFGPIYRLYGGEMIAVEQSSDDARELVVYVSKGKKGFSRSKRTNSLSRKYPVQAEKRIQYCYYTTV